jgi:hypothetical protein
MPAGVSAAAVAEAGGVPDEDLIRAEGVAIQAAGGRLGDPLAACSADQLALVHGPTAYRRVVLGVVHVPGEALRVVPARDDGIGVRG